MRLIGPPATWVIGAHRVAVGLIELPAVVVFVDGELRLAMPVRLLGEWTLPIPGGQSKLRRARNIDVAKTEVWKDSVRIPTSARHVRRRLAPEGAECAAHGSSESYRTTGAAAKYACVDCDSPRCAECLAVDGIRCAACFARAVDAYERAVRSLRARGTKLGLALAFATAVFGVIAGSPRLASTGVAGFVLLILGLLYGRHRELREAQAFDALSASARGALQAEAEKLAAGLRGDAPLRARAKPPPDRIDPPAEGPYLAATLGRTSHEGDFAPIAPAGSPLPFSTTCSVAATVRAQREFRLELATREGAAADPVPLASLRAAAFRPLGDDEHVVFTLNVSEDGALSASAEDQEAAVELRAERLDDEEARAPVALR